MHKYARVSDGHTHTHTHTYIYIYIYIYTHIIIKIIYSNIAQYNVVCCSKTLIIDQYKKVRYINSTVYQP